MCNSGSSIITHQDCMGCHSYQITVTAVSRQKHSCRCQDPIQFSSRSSSIQITNIRLHNMTTGHGVPCEIGHSLFCLNGGTCYQIHLGSAPYCRCIENYTGVRCEGIFLSSEKTQPRSEFFVNFLVLAVFLVLLFLGLICFLCRRKMNDQSEDEP